MRRNDYVLPITISDFYFYRALHEERTVSVIIPQIIEISIRLAEEATEDIFGKPPEGEIISIHALREEGDPLRGGLSL